jgi:hypothetical protein
MADSRRILRALAEGAAVHTVITATGIGALTLWARYCERHR